MIFYGTSAAEGIPSPFCRCRVCENARQSGGKEIRRRSMLRISESTCIDLGADSFQQAIEFGDFYNLRHVLITHTHEDHFAHMMMNVRNMGSTLFPAPLHLYFTGEAFDIVEFYRKSSPIIKGLTEKIEREGIISFHRLEYGKTAEIEGMTVLPLKGNHFGNMGENSANYLITISDNRKILYGLDTGWYLDETFSALKNAGLDIFISECTFGLKPGQEIHPRGHLAAPSNVLLIEKLLESGAITPDTQVYFTHINHYTTHQELCEFFEKAELPLNSPPVVVYDGYSFS